MRPILLVGTCWDRSRGSRISCLVLSAPDSYGLAGCLGQGGSGCGLGMGPEPGSPKLGRGRGPKLRGWEDTCLEPCVLLCPCRLVADGSQVAASATGTQAAGLQCTCVSLCHLHRVSARRKDCRQDGEILSTWWKSKFGSAQSPGRCQPGSVLGWWALSSLSPHPLPSGCPCEDTARVGPPQPP